MKFAITTPAPRPQKQSQLIVPYVVAAVLLAMALSQLLTLDKFVPIIQLYLPGVNDSLVKLTAVSIIFSEVFALPFLFRLRTSPLARICSAFLGFVAAGSWLVLTLSTLGFSDSTHAVGAFGSLLDSHLQTDLWVIAAFLVLFCLMTAAFMILRGPTLLKALKK